MEDVDVAGKLVLLAVGSLCLDDVIEYAGFDEFAVVASVPSLGGVGKMGHFDSPAVENVAVETDDGFIGYFPFIVGPFGGAGGEGVGTFEFGFTDGDGVGLGNPVAAAGGVAGDEAGIYGAVFGKSARC